MSHHSTSTTAPESAAQAREAATDVQQVPALHYMQLRLLAECAAGLEKDTNFVFTPEGNLEITTTPQDDSVLVPARDRSKYPRNVVRLHTAPAVPGGSVDELRLEPGFADALFWSDSAVHKFVVPYLASCAGHGAPQTLGMLRAAWNEYPAERVTVHALAHVVRHAEGVPLSMENRIRVVYAERQDGKEGTSLAHAPLGEFLKAFPPAGDPAEAGGEHLAAAAVRGSTPRYVPYRRGGESDRAQHQEYATLRALAEHACALSREPQYFIFKAGKPGFQQKTTAELPDLEPGDLVIPAYTPTRPAHRPRLHGVWCDSEDGATANLAAGSDAMFWSDGAVEQFMFPYYASKGGLHLGLKELQDMAGLWNGPAAPARPGEEQLRDDRKAPRQGAETPRVDAEDLAEGEQTLQACQEKLRECEEKLRECEQKLRAPVASAASPADDTSSPPWTPDGWTSADGTIVEEFGNAYALIHLSTSVYIAETPTGTEWQPSWVNPAGTQPSDSTTTSYLSPRREVGVLSSRGGKARVFRADELMARRRPA